MNISILERIRCHIIEHVVSLIMILSRFVSDKRKIKKISSCVYFLKTGQKMHMDNPLTYTEKLQTYKLYFREHDFSRYTDKVLVRDWIKKTIGDKYLIPTYGAWASAESIPYNSLPSSFVLKTNHGAGMNYIVKDKSGLNKKHVSMLFNKWLKKNYCYKNGLEFQYNYISPMVYAEKLLSDSNGELTEYKFLCFNGKPFFCMVDFDRFGNHERNIYDMEWNLQPWNIGFFKNCPNVPCPENFTELKRIASILCKEFSHVRVDLYDIDNQIFFSEMTFVTGSGYSLPRPASANLYLGSLWNILFEV